MLTTPQEQVSVFKLVQLSPCFLVIRQQLVVFVCPSVRLTVGATKDRRQVIDCVCLAVLPATMLWMPIGDASKTANPTTRMDLCSTCMATIMCAILLAGAAHQAGSVTILPICVSTSVPSVRAPLVIQTSPSNV